MHREPLKNKPKHTILSIHLSNVDGTSFDTTTPILNNLHEGPPLVSPSALLRSDLGRHLITKKRMKNL